MEKNQDRIDYPAVLFRLLDKINQSAAVLFEAPRYNENNMPMTPQIPEKLMDYWAQVHNLEIQLHNHLSDQYYANIQNANQAIEEKGFHTNPVFIYKNISIILKNLVVVMNNAGFLMAERRDIEADEGETIA